MYSVSRLEQGVYYANLHGDTNFDELLAMRRSLAALAVEHQEGIIVIIWQLNFGQTRMSKKGIQQYLEKRDRSGAHSIHIGLDSFTRFVISWVHRLFPHLLPNMHFASDLASALPLARRLRGKSLVTV